MANQLGTIIRSTGSWYVVKTASGEMVECRLKGKFREKGLKTTNPVAVGDSIRFSLSPGSKDAMIISIEPRKNCIIRKATNLSKQTHIIAANIDQSVLVVTLAFPRTSTGFIDRLLITAEAYHIPSVIVFNKIDLYDEALMEDLQEMSLMYRKIGYTVLHVSALNGNNINQLTSILKGKVSLLSGHSGVGKSHLINAIEPFFQLKTGSISNYHLKGKHTTTFAEMFELSFGGCIIDTPGIKEFGLVDFESWELGHWFPEFEKYIPQCKYSNCTHIHEPDCAVRQAAENKHIHPQRYMNYLNMLQNVHDEIADWKN